MNNTEEKSQSLSCRRIEYVDLTWVKPVEGYTMDQVRTLLNRGEAALHLGDDDNFIRLGNGTKIATFNEIQATADSIEYDDFQVAE